MAGGPVGYVHPVPTILVALSDGADARRVATFVNTFFRADDYEILGINISAEPAPVLSPEAGFGVMYPWGLHRDLATEEAERRERSERHAEQVVAASGLQGDEAIGRCGDPAEMIMVAATERDVDLIVVGASHGGILNHIFSPSVEKALSHRADRPLLVVP